MHEHQLVVVRDDEESVKLLWQSGFRDVSRNFTYLCWDLPNNDVQLWDVTEVLGTRTDHPADR
jgi:hypothetical protein